MLIHLSNPRVKRGARSQQRSSAAFFSSVLQQRSSREGISSAVKEDRRAKGGAVATEAVVAQGRGGVVAQGKNAVGAQARGGGGLYQFAIRRAGQVPQASEPACLIAQYLETRILLLVDKKRDKRRYLRD